MNRNVECQQKTVRVISVRGSASEDPTGLPEETEKTDVYILFYDAESESGHRNSYGIILSQEEASGFEVGQIYKLHIG